MTCDRPKAGTRVAPIARSTQPAVTTAARDWVDSVYHEPVGGNRSGGGARGARGGGGHPSRSGAPATNPPPPGHPPPAGGPHQNPPCPPARGPPARFSHFHRRVGVVNRQEPRLYRENRMRRARNPASSTIVHGSTKRRLECLVPIYRRRARHDD